jgi:hypothetical protein
MTIAVRQLEQWIGAEVLDSSAEKLGKLEDIYFEGTVALAVSIRSGLAGRKHHLAVLRGASVTRNSLQLDPSAALIATDGDGLDGDALVKLAGQDGRLEGATLADLESWSARQQRLKDEAQQQARAAQLDDEAAHRSEQEAAARARALEAADAADDARRAREDADAQAQQARDAAAQAPGPRGDAT